MTRAAVLPCVIAVAGCCAAATAPAASSSSPASRQAVRLTITGGHHTKAVDHGRPVKLIAAALGVPERVFRKAFTKVTPAPGGSEPDPEQVKRNKEALLRALKPYGVTNAKLDRVSNHYRYVPQQGKLWPHTAAGLQATVTDGRVTAVRIVRHGSGYTSTPRVAVPGGSAGRVRVKLAFGRSFGRNGRVARVLVAR